MKMESKMNYNSHTDDNGNVTTENLMAVLYILNDTKSKAAIGQSRLRYSVFISINCFFTDVFYGYLD